MAAIFYKCTGTSTGTADVDRNEDCYTYEIGDVVSVEEPFTKPDIRRFLGGVFGWRWNKTFGEYVWTFLYWPICVCIKRCSQIVARNLTFDLFRSKPKCIRTTLRRRGLFCCLQRLLCWLYTCFAVTGEDADDEGIDVKAEVEKEETDAYT